MAESQAPRSLGQSATIGVAWLMAQSVSVRAFSLISQLVLTWLLTPSDFGAIGLANSVAVIAAIVVNLGVDEVLLQRQRSIGRWAASAFWLNQGLASLGMVVLLVAAPAIARAYHSSNLTGMIVILALSMPLQALSTVFVVKARADLKFSLIAVYNMAELGASQVLTVALAWAGYGAYSFVIPIPLLAVVKAVVFWRRAPIKLIGHFQAIRFIHLAINGLTVFGSRVITEGVGQGGYIILGLMTTDAVVGLYYFAFKLAAQPVRMLAGNFHSVMFPALAQIRTDRPRQAASALHAALILSYVVMPLCFMQAALADPALRLVSGPRWSGAIVLVQVLSIGLPFDAISWMAGALLNARGEFKRSLVYSALFSSVFFVATYVGARSADALGVAVAATLFYGLTTPIYSTLVFGRAISPWRLVIDVYGTPAVLAAASMGIAYGVSLAPPIADLQIVRCLVILVVGASLYLGALMVLKPHILREIADRAGLARIVRKLGFVRLQAYLNSTS